MIVKKVYCGICKKEIKSIQYSIIILFKREGHTKEHESKLNEVCENCATQVSLFVKLLKND